MRPFRVKRDVLKFALEIGKESYPHEFVALLTGRKGLIEELLFLPFEAGESSALIHLDIAFNGH
jgi:hypothetical protein